MFLDSDPTSAALARYPAKVVDTPTPLPPPQSGSGSLVYIIKGHVVVKRGERGMGIVLLEKSAREFELPNDLRAAFSVDFGSRHQ